MRTMEETQNIEAEMMELLERRKISVMEAGALGVTLINAALEVIPDKKASQAFINSIIKVLEAIKINHND